MVILRTWTAVSWEETGKWSQDEDYVLPPEELLRSNKYSWQHLDGALYSNHLAPSKKHIEINYYNKQISYNI